MSEETQTEVVSTCKEACKMQHDGDANCKYYKDMAIYVKTQLDKKLGGSWHIIVGKLHFQIQNFMINHTDSLITFRNQFWLIRNLRDSVSLFVLARTNWILGMETWMNSYKTRNNNCQVTDYEQSCC